MSVLDVRWVLLMLSLEMMMIWFVRFSVVDIMEWMILVFVLVRISE